MYYLKDRPERAFVLEELVLIPDDQSCLLITFRNGNIYPSWIDITRSVGKLRFEFRNSGILVRFCWEFFII